VTLRLRANWEAAVLNWFHKLLPREERFFELFARHSEVVVAGAKALREMLEGGDAVTRHCKVVMDREHDADNITRDVLIAVRRSFITPFDRGDIKNLITAMDNAIDQMQKTAKTIMLFDQRAFTPQQREMGDAIVTASGLVSEAVPLLSSINTEATRIAGITEKISQIEGRADELHDIGMQELYRANLPANAMAFFVGNEIYDHLEKVADRFDDVANEIHGIVLENV
jgi:predicted phosphate transport protein (TIGR00153 family)